jgi:hypothetical protein
VKLPPPTEPEEVKPSLPKEVSPPPPAEVKPPPLEEVKPPPTKEVKSPRRKVALPGAKPYSSLCVHMNPMLTHTYRPFYEPPTGEQAATPTAQQFSRQQAARSIQRLNQAISPSAREGRLNASGYISLFYDCC